MLLCTISIVSNLNAQEDKRKNALAIALYLPIVPSNFSTIYDFNDNQNALSVSDQMSTGLNLAYGICYARSLNNGFMWRTHVGLSRFVEHTTGSGTGMNFPDFYNAKFSSGYRQSARNFLIGFGHHIPIHKGFVIDAGIQVAFFHYGERTSYFVSEVNDFSALTASQNQTFTRRETKMSGSYSIGNGIFIKPEYNFKNNFSVSLEVQFYYMFTKANVFRETINFQSQGSGILNLAPDNFQESTSYSTSLYTQKYWDWSNFSPLLRIGYRL